MIPAVKKKIAQVTIQNLNKRQKTKKNVVNNYK